MARLRTKLRRGKLLLARVPQAFHPAEGECGVLEKEDRGEPDEGPARQPDSAENGLARAPGLGTRAGKKG